MIISCLAKGSPEQRFFRYKVLILVLTFITYACFHATRKTYSVAKSTLRATDGTGWAPFTGNSGGELLGALDTIFLGSYAISLFFLGPLADNSDLTVFIPIGLLGSAFSVMLWCVAYVFDVHSYVFFIIANILSGICQATGWPAVVAVLGEWLKGNRGLIMGAWNSCLYFGNMMGSLMGAAALGSTLPWPFVFFFPALTATFVAIILAIFLVPSPALIGVWPVADENADVHLYQDEFEAQQAEIRVKKAKRRKAKREAAKKAAKRNGTHDSTAVAQVSQTDLDDSLNSPITYSPSDISSASTQVATKKGITFIEALSVPGVLEFSLALFFAKLVSYTFLFWLPSYLTSLNYSDTQAASLSIYFDIGGILGSMICGRLSDMLGKPGFVSSSLLLCAMPALFGYRFATSHDIGGTIGNASFMLILGIIVNGPYALITTAVSTDLGSHPDLLKKGASAMSSVVAVVDGFGSLGSLNCGLVISLVSRIGPEKENWNSVFIFLMLCCGAGGLLLTRIVLKEFGIIRPKNDPDDDDDEAQLITGVVSTPTFPTNIPNECHESLLNDAPPTYI